jgi:hypothetical protein
MLQISCPVAATGISVLCSSLFGRRSRFQAPFFICLLYNKAPVLFACVLRRGAAGEAAAAQAQVGVRSRTLSLACGMRWRITGYYLPIKGKDNTWIVAEQAHSAQQTSATTYALIAAVRPR